MEGTWETDRKRVRNLGRETAGAVGAADPMGRLREEAAVLERWLFDKALPLWWSKGADHARGGFEDLLALDGSPVAAPRRARVQARQVYVYATVGVLRWDGPWRLAVDHGIDYLVTRFVRPEGLVRASVSPTGAPLDEGPKLYDQAFALLALAAADAATQGAAQTGDRARALLGAVESRFRHDRWGYRSGDHERPFQSNPQMHLFEAALAWMAHDPSPLWSDLAERIATLAMTRFVDPSTGALREVFDERWAPAAGAADGRVEPGHQFEWAWLLGRWDRLTGNPAATTIANRLLEIGVDHGVDRGRNVAMDALDERLAPLEPSARLWPQTERIKAALSAAEFAADDRDRHLSRAVDGVVGMKRYLLPNGTWRDRLNPDGLFVHEPAPASSLYHIVGAIAEVSRAAKSFKP